MLSVWRELASPHLTAWALGRLSCCLDLVPSGIFEYCFLLATIPQGAPYLDVPCHQQPTGLAACWVRLLLQSSQQIDRPDWDAELVRHSCHHLSAA